MEIQVKKLRQTLQLLEPAAPRKAAFPMTTYVYLGEGKAVATDLETAVTVNLPEANEPMLLSPREVLPFLNYTPGHLTATLTRQGKAVSIVAGSATATFNGDDPADYPPIPKLEDGHEGVLDGDALVRQLMAVLPCTTTKEDRPVLTAICLSTGDTLEVAAADGFRLAWESLPGKLPTDKSLLIPRRAVKLLDALWQKVAVPDLHNASTPVQVALAKRPIRLTWSEHLLELRFGLVLMTVHLIDGDFPEYKKLIPTESVANVTVRAEDVIRALLQVKRLAKESSSIVRLVWNTAGLKVSANAPDVGEVATVLWAEANVPGRTALDFNLLRDYFTGKTGDVIIALSSANAGPVMFTHRGSLNVVIMPMAVTWDDEAPREASKAEEAVADETTVEPAVEAPPHGAESCDPEKARRKSPKRKKAAVSPTK